MGDEQKVGAKAVLDTSELSKGIAAFNQGMAGVVSKALDTAKGIKDAFLDVPHKITAAFKGIGAGIRQGIGIGIGFLGVTQALPALLDIPSVVMGKLNAYTDDLNKVNSVLGIGTQQSAAYVGAMKTLGLSVAQGSSAFQSFADKIRQTSQQIEDAQRSMALALRNNEQSVFTTTRNYQEGVELASLQIGRELENRTRQFERHVQDLLLITIRSTEDQARNAFRFEREAKEQLRGVHGRARRLLKLHLQEQREDTARSIARTQQDREIAARRESEDRQRTQERAQQDNARTFMLLERNFKESMRLLKQGMDDMMKTAAISESRNPVLRFLKKYGIDLKEVSDEAIPLITRINKVWDALRGETDATEKAKVMTALFGNSSVELTRFLNKMNVTVKETDKLFASLGLKFDPDLIESYNQSVGRLGLIFDAVGLVIAQSLAPYMTDINNTVSKMLTDILPPTIKLLGDMAEAFKKEGFTGVFNVLRQWAVDHKGEIDAAMQFVGDMIIVGIKGISGLGKALGDVFKSATEELLKPSVDEKGQSSGASWATTFMSALIGALAEAIRATTLFVGLVAAFMVKFTEGLTVWLKDQNNITLLKSYGAVIGSAFADGLGSALFSRVGEIMQQLDYVLNHIASAISIALGGGAQPVLDEALQWLGNPSGKAARTIRGSRAEGGPIPSTGLYQLHAGEYVLNRAQVMQLVPAMSGGGGNNYSFSHTWNGPASSFDKSSIAQTVQEMTMAAIRQVLPVK